MNATEPSPRSPTRVGSHAARIVRTLVLAGIALWLAARIVGGWPAIRATRLSWNPLELLASALAAALSFECLFAGWLVLLRRTGLFEPGHFAAYHRVWWLSYLWRWVPGKVLVLVERARMGAALGVPPAVGAALAVVETLLAVLAACWVAPLALLFHLEGGADDSTALIPALAAAAVAGLVGLPLGYRWIARSGPVRRRLPGLATLHLGGRDVLAAAPAFVAHYLFAGLAFFLFARGLPPLVASQNAGFAPFTGFAGFTGVYALAQVSGLVSLLAPAGLGVREGVLAVQLARALPAGLAEALAVGLRLWLTLIELVCVGLVLVTTRRLGRRPPSPH